MKEGHLERVCGNWWQREATTRWHHFSVVVFVLSAGHQLSRAFQNLWHFPKCQKWMRLRCRLLTLGPLQNRGQHFRNFVFLIWITETNEMVQWMKYFQISFPVTTHGSWLWLGAALDDHPGPKWRPLICFSSAPINRPNIFNFLPRKPIFLTN